MADVQTTSRSPAGLSSEKVWLALGLIGFLLLQYGNVLVVPFMGDDYLFLNEVRGASFGSLWLPNTTISAYYRPWSRELHYWLLSGVFGPSAVVFHAANLLLWLAAMGLFHQIAARIAGPRAAIASVCGAALQAGWGTPLVWVAGVQDLWMIVTGLAFVMAAMGRRRLAASAFLVLSLLSKETAAVLPAIASAYALLVERRRFGDAARATAGYWAILAVWVALHPMLGGRLLHPVPGQAASGGVSLVSLGWSMLSVVNLDTWPKPEHGWLAVATGAAPAILLLIVAWLGLRTRPDTDHEVGPQQSAVARVAAFGSIWALLAWAPLLQPGLEWQAYYGLLGAFGAWLAMGAWLARRPRAALVLLAALGLVRSAHSQTPMAVMGSEWNQRRVGLFTGRMHDDLLRLHPSLPAHARVFFGDVPWGLGMISSHPQSPALRIWYRDTTLSGGFYNRYHARGSREAPGQDYFFLFGPEGHLVEVVEEPEPLTPGRPPSSRWADDHYFLARLLFKAGDLARSQRQLEKLVTVFPQRFEYVYNLGQCQLAMGDTTSGMRRIREAQALPGAPDQARPAVP